MRRLGRSSHRDEVLDDGTVDRLLSGRLPADDAPPQYRDVATLVGLMTASATDTELEDRTGVVAAMTDLLAASQAQQASRMAPMSKQRLAKFAAVGTIGAMSLFGGLAAAGALPGAAQGVASNMLDKVGVSVPNPDHHAGTNPDIRGRSESHTTDESTASTTSTSVEDHGQGQGQTISDLARTTTATGDEKGAVISAAASDGKSHAGDSHPGTTTTEPSSTTTTTEHGNEAPTSIPPRHTPAGLPSITHTP